MAENLDNQSFGNFSIQDTMDMGMGSAELLNDLMGSETSTTNPDDIQDINTPDKTTEPAPAPAKKAAPAAETDSKEKEDNTKSLQDFLLGGDDAEEEEEDETPAPTRTKTPKAETSTDDENVDEEDEDSPESTFASLSKDLFKLGVFSQDEDDEEEPISTPEQFLERFNAEKKKGAIEVVENFLGQFGEDYRNAFDAIFVKGVDPQDYFGTFNKIQSFAEMDLADEGNQVAVLRQALADQGFEPEDVTTEIERLKNYGDLESVATKHHKVLVKKEAAKLQQLEQQKEQQLIQQAQYKQQYAANITQVLQDKLKAKEFDGIPLNPKLAGELQDFLVTDRYKTPTGEMLTEFDRTILDLKRPENHEKKVKVGLLLKILEKDPTLSTIQKTGLTKKSNELFGEVARQAQKSAIKSGNKSQAKPNSWFV
jgi:HPt (histidine-containing phosphotransfer) domain-containing protein